MVAAPNAAGKTSVAQAAAALLTGESLPLEGVKKSEAGMLVRAGSGASVISLGMETDNRVISYPKAVVETEGNPPTSTRIAVGLDKLSAMNAKERSSFLAELLKTTPTKEDFEKAIGDFGFTTETVEALWRRIEGSGWDGAAQKSKENGAKLKGQWEDTTGANYGSDKAEKWLPPAWEPEMEGASEEALESIVVGAREQSDATMVTEAIDAEDRKRLENEAKLAHDLRVLMTQKTAELDALRMSADNERGVLNDLPKPIVAEIFVPCPYCDKGIIIDGGALRKAPEEIDESENESRQKALDKQGKNLAAIAKEASSFALEVAEIKNDLAVAERAETNLAVLPEENQEQGTADTEWAKEAVRAAESRLEAFRAKTKADGIHASVKQNVALLQVLASDGLRMQALKRGTEEFQTNLNGLSELAGWEKIDIQSDLSFWYGSRPWVLCSKSEQFRANVLLQLAVATTDGSQGVVIDEADILDKEGRNGLFTLLQGTPFLSMVCMTLVDRDEMSGRTEASVLGAAMEGMGIGSAYWIADGIASRVNGDGE